ncbi:MAG: NAD-dependent epimerase/dehydratase family protein [Alphaproteobacteria bacterium]|nr:NAD-dependent epimerase/dehydratase family protein [Alphaproteobacteria bacterium]MDE2012769.1 NAD-dependent epimerase/dehydratase family protein [Alphaproteobacteria bacterium]MDE2074117.1 NAD-dependent epimerase/dehydratase family protein [Alphaproteobacteria bacterium]MDE2353258.1 NAD-dependent epimerase/dehydratase family protein [Alphaproteobacteria bacterium]
MKTALVTGGSGYVAGHLVDLLLAEGYQVHATVRSLSKPGKLTSLNALKARRPGRLKLFEADLMKPGSFDAATKGCDVVFHVASPFLFPEQIKDGRRELLEPALEGTRNVLGAVDACQSVQRVVLTSTVGAIFGDYIDVLNLQGGVLQERFFNTTSTLENNPYHYSKVMAEHEAWAICGRQSRWSMVAINPGLILGPALTPVSDSGSLFLLDELLKGYFFYGAPNFAFTYVDVRDVALAHLRAAEREAASGRYILAEKGMISFLDMARMLRPHHRRPWLLPRYRLPHWPIRILGPLFGLTQDYIRGHLGIRFTVDNRRSVEELGIAYRSAAETLADHYRSWLRWHNQKWTGL